MRIFVHAFEETVYNEKWKREKERDRGCQCVLLLDYGWDCSNLGFVTRNALTGHCNDFEQEGVSSSINGIHATALYIGILVISPFLEKPMQRFGMKPIIVIGGFLVIISLFFYTNIFILGMVYP